MVFIWLHSINLYNNCYYFLAFDYVSFLKKTKYNFLACLLICFLACLLAYKLLNCVDTLITTLYHDIKNSLAEPILKNNLTKREALTTYNREIAAGEMDVEDYIKEANKQFSHTSGISHRKIKAIIKNYKELNYKEVKLNYYYEKLLLLSPTWQGRKS